MAMEKTRIAKVEDVTVLRRGEQANGTLHLTPHHLIFVHTPVQTAGSVSPARPRELWITYPIISFCTLRPSPAISRHPSSIRLRCRDFTFVCFYFQDDRKARDVYDSIRAWTCKLGKIEKLYAFTYKPQGPERDVIPQGWAVYDPMREWRRQGIEDPDRKLNWRISRINHDYQFSPTYPALLPVPSSISDNTLNYAGRYRSKARVPTLSYIHPVNNCTITRCSQPMVGVRQNRSIQDETLMAAIFSTTRTERPLSGIRASTPDKEREISPPIMDTAKLGGDLRQSGTEAVEDAVIASLQSRIEPEVAENDDLDCPTIYGAQQNNLIVDARPTVNALAQQAVGMGSENMDNYKFATKAYLGIDNIHVMRDSLNKVVEALKDSDLTPLGPNRELLRKSHWLKHIANMLDGVSLIVRQVGLHHSHVLIHCSDGWDRTSQLSALSQICLDPYFRTIEGFIVLVEKDFLSYGHQFRHRTGFLSSEKWFLIENERVGGRHDDEDGDKLNDTVAGAQRAFGNAFLSAKGFFTKQNNDSRESLHIDSEGEPIAEVDLPNGRKGKADKDKSATKVKETAPIFHQFLDATFQLMWQHPTRFEYNDRFLRRLLYHLYSCQYGTFLFDSEQQRKEAKIEERTTSVWNYFLCRRKEFTNPDYDPEIDDNVRGRERLIFPRAADTKWWASVFGRTEEEMNGSAKTNIDAGGYESESIVYEGSDVPQSAPSSRPRSPVLIGAETSNTAVGVGPLLKFAHSHELATKFSTETAVQDDHKPDLTTAQSKNVNGTGSIEKTYLQDSQAQVPDSAPAQETLRDAMNSEPPESLDPLGMESVKEYVPSARKPAERRREQLEILMQ